MKEIRERVFFWMDKIEVFGKALNKPKVLSGSSAPIPEPFGGIPSGVFAIFAVIILTLSIANYIPGDNEDNVSSNTLTSSQSAYLAVSYTHLTLPTKRIV